MSRRGWTQKEVAEYCERIGKKPPVEALRGAVRRERGEGCNYGVPQAENQGESAFKFYWNLLAGKAEKPVEQYKFRPGRNWRVDFAFPAEKVAIECNGQVHAILEKREADYEKWNALAIDGWSCLMFSPRRIENDPKAVIGFVLEVLEKKRRDEG